MSYYIFPLSFSWGPCFASVKHMPCFPNGAVESACQCRRCKRHEFHPWVRKIPCSRKRQPAPIFLPGKFHGQRNLAATVHGVAKSQIQLSTRTCTSSIAGSFWRVPEVRNYRAQGVSLGLLYGVKNSSYRRYSVSYYTGHTLRIEILGAVESPLRGLIRNKRRSTWL